MTPPMPILIAPPTRVARRHTSMLCAQPSACSWPGPQERAGEPARLAARSALLGDPADHGVGGGPQVVAPLSEALVVQPLYSPASTGVGAEQLSLPPSTSGYTKEAPAPAKLPGAFSGEPTASVP